MARALRSPDGVGRSGAVAPTAPPSVRTVRGADKTGVQPKYPAYGTTQSREASFRAGSVWPEGRQQKPAELAIAGFFFAGILDCTRCFFCGIGLKNWQLGDDPISEHQKYSQNCAYLKKEIQRRLFAKPGKVGKSKHDINLAVNSVLAKPSGAALGALGYPERLIRQAIIKVLEEKDWDDSCVTSEHLALALFDLKDEEEKTNSSSRDTTDTGSSRTGRDEVDCAMSKSAGQDTTRKEVPSAVADAHDVPSTTSSPNNSVDEEICQLKKGLDLVTVSRLEEENRKLKNSRTCKICLDEDVSVVYLPCAHLVTCHVCYSTQRRCPICRSPINAYVKTYS